MQARDAVDAAGLGQVEVRTVDAGDPAAYEGAAPADVVLLVGIFGNVADADVWRLVEFAPRLCSPGATLIWSRGRHFTRDLPGVTRGDLNDAVRARFGCARADRTRDRRSRGARPSRAVRSRNCGASAVHRMVR